MNYLPLLLLAATLPAQAATVTSYGTGCKGLTLSMSLPRIGTTVNIMVANRSTMGTIWVGTNKLNISMGNGCTILTDVKWTIPYMMPLGDASHLPIPNAAWLVGVEFTVQAADYLLWGTSQGLVGRIGR